MNDPEGSYDGYLAPHIDCIRTMHLAGANTRAIAEELYRRGARAQTTNVFSPKMQRAHHVTNLRTMTLHVLQRLALRTRHSRPPRWP